MQRVHKDGKPLLIRYGPRLLSSNLCLTIDRPGFKVSLDSSHPLLRTLIIPSKLLEQNKVEILLHQAVLEDERSIHPTKEILSSLLSPSLHAQQSFSGRTTSVIYPVHKTILLENGLGSFLSLAGLLQSKGGKIASRLLHIVSNVNWDVLPGDQHKVFFVNTAKALHAVQAFRENIQNSILYEREWLSSGISSLIPIVLPGISNNATLKPVVRDLIEHILEETELAISTSEAESMQQSLDLTIGEAPRKRFQEDIDIWAEQAHTEFRMGLAILIQSRAWQKLAWWKLLWRVDDIEMITSEAIHQSYLINAQATIMFVAGKLSQAGLLGEDTPSAQSKVDIDSEKRQYSNRFDADTKAPAVTMSNLLPPWPVQIFLSRRSILENTIPPLAACAQRYLLSALSVTGLTSLTSILAYFSVTTTTLYEAGTIAAVGFMFSAYRLQTKWEKARHNWITGVEIEGKRTLDEVEKASREVVETGGRSMMDKTGMTERANARNAISEVRRSLAKLSDGS